MIFEKRPFLISLLWIFISGYPTFSQSITYSDFSEKLNSAKLKLNEQFFKKDSTDLNCEYVSNSLNHHTKPLNFTLSDINRKKDSITYYLSSQDRTADTIYLGDTLVIGFEPGEELLIDSEWIHYGPILIIGDGILRFEGAHATILGDIITAENGQLIADSSHLYFPQDYFYQRILLLTGNSIMSFRNSTLDFGGLVHNMATVGTSVLEFFNVEKPDFSTVGMYEESVILIDSIDVAGEFIIDDEVRLEIKNSETILLWHQLDNNAIIDIEFPDGDSVDHYEFNDQQSGISGVGYDILIDNCTEVMWGLMPAKGSDATISNSEIRTIGFWFEESDSIQVNGLVNNNYYGDYTAPLSDRNFHLINSDVMTWSLYSFDSAYVDVEGCILGEIGVMGHSEVSAFNYFCDGSGGYLWAGDTTFLVSGMSSLSSALRSTHNSILIFAYSTQMNGLVQALDNSIIMLIQSNISAAPTYDPGAVIWMANISDPGSAYQNSIVPIVGSAWIDKGNQSELMDFGYYVISYQKDGDTTWQMIGDTNYLEIRDDVLINWNTQSVEPGAYYLKLDLWDNWDNGATATSGFTLLPDLLGTPDALDNQMNFDVFPNPVQSTTWFRFTLDIFSHVNLKIYDMHGKEVAVVISSTMDSGEHQIGYDISNLPKGIYYPVLSIDHNQITKKLILY